ncbi:MAG: DUF2167 domain-containing protein [Syntrophobacteraceae bacterium]
MKQVFSVVFILTALLCLAAPAGHAQQQSETSLADKIKLQEGPSTGDLGKVAQVRVPEGFVFAGAADTQLLMEAMHNPVSGAELGFLAPTGANWFVVFEYDEVGYIKDDEKGSLDADAMLKSIQQGNEAGNKERINRGWATLNITGWEQPPRYNPETQNLEWAIKGESEGHPIVNWNTRLLGREGVMKVTLVAGPDELQETLPSYSALLADYSYKSGHRYAEFTQGDKVAKYGLSALVVGGATAVAAKSGLLKSLWKAIVVGVLAAGAFFRKIFSRKKDLSGTPSEQA